MTLKKYIVLPVLLALSLALFSGCSGFKSAPHAFSGGRDAAAPAADTESGFDTNTYHFSAAQVEKIDIDEAFSAIELLPSDDRDIHLVCMESREFYYALECSGGSLSITRKSSIDLDGDLLSLHLDGNDLKLRLYIPADLTCDLDCDNDCGDITLSGLALDDADIDTAYGSVILNELQARSLSCDTDCGSVSICGASVAGDVSAGTDYGDVGVSSVSALGHFACYTDCGNVELADVSADDISAESDFGNVSADNIASAGDVSLTTESGDVSFSGLSAKESVTLESNFGKVEGILAGAAGDYAISSQADIGNNSLPKSTHTGRIALSVHTGCGDIDVRFEKKY